MFLLLACTDPTPGPRPADTADSAPIEETVPLDWGVTSSCESSADGGFDAFYGSSGETYLVSGDEALGEQVHAWYAGYFDDLVLLAPEELGEEHKGANLFLVGSPENNPILNDLDGLLPVSFEQERFTFGGYRWDNPGDGIAMVHPNPWSAGSWLLLHVGNTHDGSWATFTVPTGQKNFHVVHGRGTEPLRGNWCNDGDMRHFYADRAKDEWADYLDWTANATEVLSTYHRHLVDPDSDASPELLGDYQDGFHEEALEILEIEALDVPITSHWYGSNEQKGQETGSSGNAHANDLALATFHVYGNGVYAAGNHEDVHVLAWHRIGQTHFTIMGEGLAVMTGGQWWGEPLEGWVSTWKAEGSLLSLRELIDSFWSNSDEFTYPTSGHFVDYLRRTYGMDTVKRLYVAEDLDQAFEDELGMTTEELEEAWVDSIP